MFPGHGLTQCMPLPRMRATLSLAAAPGSVPLYLRGSSDYATPASAALGQGKGLSFSGPSGGQPMRNARIRRMSADAPPQPAGVRQLAMMQAAAVPVPQEVVLDLVSGVAGALPARSAVQARTSPSELWSGPRGGSWLPCICPETLLRALWQGQPVRAVPN